MISVLTGEPVTDPLLAAMRADERRQRRAIEEVLNPGRRVSYPHVDFAVSLALRYDWHVKSEREFGSFKATRTIHTTPLYGDEELATFVHEGGHLEDRDPPRGRVVEIEGARFVDVCSMDGEAAAWRFAIKTLGRRWNRTMQQHFETCIRTYHGICIETYPELLVMEAVIAEGAEQALQGVRIWPRSSR